MTAELMTRSVMADPNSAPAGVAAGISWYQVREIASAGATGSSGEPVTDDTVFDLASVTKVAATTCTLQRLAALGEVNVDDPVRTFLPDSPCTDDTTLADLLSHRAGLWEWQPLYLSGRDPWQTINDLPLRYAPHSGRHYSDLGFMLLGRIISKITGLPLDGAVSELVTGPLGLSSMVFRPKSPQQFCAAAEPRPVPGIASSAWGDDAERQMVATGEPYPIVVDKIDFSWRTTEICGEVDDGNSFYAFGGISGHAGLFSTVGDLLTLAASLASETYELWGEQASARFFADGPDAGQALGWRSMPIRLEGRRTRMLWHHGFTGTAVGFIPHNGFAVAMVTNRLLAGRPVPTRELWEPALETISALTLEEDKEGMTR
ncbi:serine hydrolase domain-containing protein [Propionimicrobium sp. PCR01-08-3]|uniref:serine hydrolase domain-containing protein n=1 Tax=Propionimicrobium sp. PCR01-08-3 TaxID=3052086 RepID=UPI00255CE61A|nr:serine hydrolase domain-containing protein [Propionimicrobium sp. PCR01-08-3]WIY82443.1 serine hydrolase domain-containing protein [Propionimicrobium sp. PCR01-08-3]